MSETTETSLPPGPRGPALWNSIRYLRDPFGSVQRWRERHGDLFTLPTANGTVVCACTPALAKTFYTAPPDIWATFTQRAAGEVFGNLSVLITDGVTHKRQRKLLMPPFRGERMRVYGAIMRDATVRAFADVSPGDELRLHEKSLRIGMEVICRAVFGVDDDADVATARSSLESLLPSVPSISLFSPMFQTEWFPPWRRFTQLRLRFDGLVREIIASRRAAGDAVERSDILSLLLQARTEDGEGMSDDEVRDQLLAVLAAGHETTAIAVAWAVHDLLGRPDALARVREEVDALGEDPDPDALAKLPYLDAVATETLRYRSVVSDVPRVLREPLEIGDHRVPAGVAVTVMFEAIHNDPDIYEAPQEFRPERFLGQRPKPFAFLPFGGGHRRCLGAAFSDYEQRIVVATIVRHLALERLAEDDRVRRNIVMAPAKGVPVRVLARRAAMTDVAAAAE